MSDTTTITPEERSRLRSVLSEHGTPQVEERIILRLLNTIEQAEASANDNSDALTAAYMSGKYDGRKEAEANVARLTKELDWLAELVFDRPCAYACCPFDKHRPTGPDDDDCDKTHIQCWAEAARRAVAAGEG